MSLHLRFSFNVLLCLATIFMAACAKFETQNTKVPEFKVHEERQAPTAVKDSFDVQRDNKSEDDLTSNGFVIILKKSALGKAFLLSPTIILRTGTPIIDHINPKIVSFEKAGDQLALFELNPSAVYQNLKSDKLLQTFRIETETDDSLHFSWKYGLSAVPMVSFLAGGASDFPASDSSAMSPILPVDKTFVRSAQVKGNAFEIEQISEIHIESIPFDLGSLAMAFLSGGGLNSQYLSMTVQLNVNLRPYIQNSKFKMRPSAFFEGIGAFETPVVRKGDGKVDYYASLWDLSPERGPLTYAITKGTPQEFVEPIKEGILYWNKVAGREIIRVIVDADAQSIPTERVVLVHWIPWDRAGMARASFHADPLTGEILRADVYLTSTFAKGANVGYREAFENILRDDSKLPVIVPGFFRSGSRCNYTKSYLADAQVWDFARSTVNNELVQRYVSDQIREVTAHEVGHTLGMRHNFAGSLATQIQTAEDQTVKETKYLEGKLPQGAAVSSSVMDYIFGLPGGLLGAYIQHSPLSYDQAFINWSYNGKTEIEKTTPLFCSDMLADSMSGCRRGDVGTNTFSAEMKRIQYNLRLIENLVLQKIIMVFHPKNPLDKMTPNKLAQALANVNLDGLVKTRLTPFENLRSLMLEGAEDFSVESRLGRRGWMNQKDYDSAMTEKLRTELNSVGGIEKMLKDLIPMNDQMEPRRGWLKENLLKIYQNPSFKSGTTFEGVSYTLTTDEFNFIGALIESFADKVEEIWIKKVIELMTFEVKESSEGTGALALLGALTGESKENLSLEAGQETWWPLLAKLAQKSVLQRRGETKSILDDKEVVLPNPSFSVDLRVKAIKLMKPEGYRLPFQTTTEKSDAKKEILTTLGLVLGKTFTSKSEVETHIKTVSMNIGMRNWLKDELQVLKDLE